MKKFLFAVIFPLFYFITALFPLAPPRQVCADSSLQYACVLTDKAYFYTSENEKSGVFILPKTYYVKVLSQSSPYTKVEYLSDGVSTRKLTGYCLTADLTFVDYIPQQPYLFKIFEVTYTAESGEANDPFLDKITLTCSYYGDYTVGSKTYAYVLQGEDFCYVPKPADLFIPENTEYAERTRQDTDEPNGETPTSGTNPTQIAILVVLCLLVPILAALIFRSSKKQPYDFDEE